jgi:hypothetical protein
MAVFVGLDVSLRTTSICVVEANGSPVWEGKAKSEPTMLIKALIGCRNEIALVGLEACPLSEWLFGALVESGFQTVCIETRHAQRFLSSRPNKTDRSDARGIAEMLRLGHYRPVHVKSKASQLLRTTLTARQKFTEHMVAIETTIRGLLKVHGLKGRSKRKSISFAFPVTPSCRPSSPRRRRKRGKCAASRSRVGWPASAAIHRDLVAYAEVLKRDGGHTIDPNSLVAPMLMRFMATDRAFRRARRRIQNDGG